MPKQTLAEMVDWIEENLTEEPTLEALAARFGYSPCYCSAQLRRYMAMPLRAYLSRRRVERAAVELLAGYGTVLDVAVRYGFSSHAAFTRAFVRYFGVTPSVYRRQSTNPTAKAEGVGGHEDRKECALLVRQRKEI